MIKQSTFSGIPGIPFSGWLYAAAIVGILGWLVMPDYLEAQLHAGLTKRQMEMCGADTNPQGSALDENEDSPGPAVATLLYGRISRTMPVAYVHAAVNDRFQAPGEMPQSHPRQSMRFLAPGGASMKVALDMDDKVGEKLWICGNKVLCPMPYDPANESIGSGALSSRVIKSDNFLQNTSILRV